MVDAESEADFGRDDDDDDQEEKDRGSSDDSEADYEPRQCKKYGRDSGPLAWYGGGSSPKKKAKLQQRTPQEASSSLQQRERATGGTPAPPDMIGQTSKHLHGDLQLESTMHKRLVPIIVIYMCSLLSCSCKT